MQKKLIALAVAGILAAPMAANAEVEIYGKARVSVDFTDNGDATTTNDDSRIAVTSNSSRLGFKGSEDLGGGLIGIWQIEAQVDFDDDNNGLFDGERNTFAGLAGDFGTVVFGRHDTPYKMATKDIFGDTRADYNGGTMNATVNAQTVNSAKTGPIRIDNRADNVIAYLSPDMNGFSAALAYVTDIDDDDLAAAKNGSTDAISAMAAYKSGPLGVSVAIETLGEAGFTATGSTTKDDITGTKIGATYDVMAGTTLTFIYEMVDYGTAGTMAVEQNAIYLAAKHSMGNGLTGKIAYGMIDDYDCTGCNDSGATYMAFGVDKKLSDKVEVYALYTAHDPDKNAAIWGIDNVDGASNSNGDPETTSAFSVGLNINFSSM